jgi:hypothetical protein
MIYHCMMDGRYSMTADIYRPVKSQNAKTGEIISTWQYVNTIPCFAWGITASGKDLPGTFEEFDNKYSMMDVVRIISRAAINKDYRVVNIRNLDGSIWTEDATGLATVFDSRGSVPITDAFGTLMEHTSMLTRAEVQTVPPDVLSVQGGSQGEIGGL